ncbi:hypothetical protein EAE96_004059 [Botrytis aclada]|nr:hypothetical protein EAE96_004059 [Botrytis aclada]
MRLHRVFLFVFIGNAIAAVIVERAKETDCSLTPSLCSTKKSSSTTSSSTTSSTTSSSTTSSSSSTIQTTGTLTANFAASATAATATCGAGFLPQAATNQARNNLLTNTTSTCATISPGWPCFGAGKASQGTIPALIDALNPPEYQGTLAFLCNLSEVPMTTAGFDIGVLDDLIYLKHCANYTPAALVSPGEWVYGYLDANTAQMVGHSRELCTYVMSQVVAYPSPMS